MPFDPKLPLIGATRPEDVVPGTVIPPDVQTAPCAGCGRAVLLSPSSRKLMDDGLAQPACRDCVHRHLAGKAVIGIMTPEAAEELKRYAADEARRN